MKTLKIFLLCSLTAALCGLASPNLHWHPLCWVLLIPLLTCLEDTEPGQAFRFGWLCGILIHLVCFTWVIETVQRYSNLNFTLSVMAWILFGLYSGLAFGLMAALFRIVSRAEILPDLVVFPLFYVAMEYLFPYIFPWHLGSPLYGVLPAIQISDLFGIYGVTFLVVLVNTGLWEVVRCLIHGEPFPARSLTSVLLVVAVSLTYGFWRIKDVDKAFQSADREDFSVGIVQANVRTEEKRSPLLQEDIWRRYKDLSMEAVSQGADLLVWPESSVNFAYSPQGSAYSSSGFLRRLVASFDRPLLFGTWSRDAEGPRNTAYLIGPKGEDLGRYDKIRLLAFGEYMPLSDVFPQLQEWISGVGNFKPGTRLEPLCHGDKCFGVLICFEAIEKDLSREMVKRGASFLVNITNDVWFGDTSCPEQHLMLTSFRAIENRIWLVRAANTGISAFVDPVGRILKRTPPFEQAVRVHTIQPKAMFSLYRAWGDWFAILCALSVPALTLAAILRRHREHHPRG